MEALYGEDWVIMLQTVPQVAEETKRPAEVSDSHAGFSKAASALGAAAVTTSPGGSPRNTASPGSDIHAAQGVLPASGRAGPPRRASAENATGGAKRRLEFLGDSGNDTTHHKTT